MTSAPSPATGAADRVELVLVPREPTEAMIEAGMQAEWEAVFTGDYHDPDPEDVSRDSCREGAIVAYRAMVKAHAGPPSSGAGAAGLDDHFAVVRNAAVALAQRAAQCPAVDGLIAESGAACGAMSAEFRALRATIACQADDLERLRGKVEPAPVRDMVVAYAHSVCSAAAYPNTSVEHRWLRDRWLAALDALGLTEEQARNECRAAMRGIYAARPSADQREGADEGGGRP